MKKSVTTNSDLICSLCGNIMPIPRNKKNQRNIFHIKDLYCYRCKKITKHIELQNGDMLKKELEFNNERTEIEEFIYNLLIKEDNAKIKD